MDCSLSGFSVHGIFQAIVREWIAISFSKGSSWPRDQTRVSHIVDRRLTIWTTREEELKSLLMKEESEKVGLKINIQKTKIMASGPITSWEIDRETVETVTDFIILGSKITAAMKLKDAYSLERKLWPT